jgi:hypothetical protein
MSSVPGTFLTGLSRTHWRLLYLLLGQAGWLICVLSAAGGSGWGGVLFVALLLAGHLASTTNRSGEAAFVAIVTLAGWVWESVVLRTGWLAYPNGMLLAGYAPYWMAGLWALFALQINPLFSWLRTHRALAALCGAVGDPLSFRAGAALGAIRFIDTWPAVALIAAGWSVIFPTLLWLGQRIAPEPGADNAALHP